MKWGMGGGSQVRIFGNRVRGARIGLHVRERAEEATREADAAECLLWSTQMEQFGGAVRTTPTIALCLNARHRWLKVMCHRRETRAGVPLHTVRRQPGDAGLEAALKCRSCRTQRINIVRLTREPKINPCVGFTRMMIARSKGPFRSPVHLATSPRKASC
jgi:hypothetical protein